MRWLLLLLLITPVFSQETRAQRQARRGQNAGYASREATAASMMGWGLGIAVGIAVLTGMIHNNDGTSSTSH
jgi:hypothetical protein